ncbi:hypothetical protein [Gimesia aquarii]|uniref:Uncharacterized protein n=1 Tax=Gimesia aquarii TaxID=2527964 RepID=A0A517X2X2_9PLAN|nr:hypothetical protein [Gimesia aquarii]QDU11855.1 hypothetical protein V202x_52800 [Gimesia aquarii]
MTTIGIFLLGIFVTGLTFTAVILVGLQEAADDSNVQVEDTTEI